MSEAESDKLILGKKPHKKQGAHHQTVPILYPRRGEEVEIDCGIAELMNEIWKQGIWTNNSCENNKPDGYVWICFDMDKHLRKLLGIVFDDVDSRAAVYRRAFSPDAKHKWIYNPIIIRPGRSIVSLRFPTMDYDFVLEKVKAWNMGEEEVVIKNETC